MAPLRFSTRTPTELAPVPVAVPVKLLTVMSPAPVALSRCQMPWPALPVMLPVAVSEMSPTPFWVTTRPLMLPVSVPAGVRTISP